MYADGRSKCTSVLKKIAAEAAAAVQLLTIHVAEPEDDGSITVLATTLGGEELGQVQVDPSNTMASVIAESPRERRFMLADGRFWERGDEDKPLKDWLSATA